MANDVILGEISKICFDNGVFDIRDASLIFYGKYEQVIEVIGVNILSIKQELDTLIGGTT